MRRLAAIAAFAAALASPASAAPDQAQAVLAAAKAAAGGAAWDQLTGWDETGAHGGASYETKLDPHGYGMVSTTVRGAEKVSKGYNGVVVWRTGPDGKTEIYKDPANLADARQSTYGSIYAFFLADRFSARFTYLGETSADGGDFDVIRIEPAGSKPMDIWVDRTSHLVVRFVDNTGPKPVTARLSDFRTVDGVKVPFRLLVSDGDSAHTQKVQVASIVIEPIARAAFDPPAH